MSLPRSSSSNSSAVHLSEPSAFGSKLQSERVGTSRSTFEHLSTRRGRKKNNKSRLCVRERPKLLASCGGRKTGRRRRRRRRRKTKATLQCPAWRECWLLRAAERARALHGWMDRVTAWFPRNERRGVSAPSERVDSIPVTCLLVHGAHLRLRIALRVVESLSIDRVPRTTRRMSGHEKERRRRRKSNHVKQQQDARLVAVAGGWWCARLVLLQ